MVLLLCMSSPAVKKKSEKNAVCLCACMYTASKEQLCETICLLSFRTFILIIQWLLYTTLTGVLMSISTSLWFLKWPQKEEKEIHFSFVCMKLDTLVTTVAKIGNLQIWCELSMVFYFWRSWFNFYIWVVKLKVIVVNSLWLVRWAFQWWN